MSTSGLHRRLTTNMTKMKKLRDKLKKIGESIVPCSNQHLPKPHRVVRRNNEEEDREELDLLKQLLIDDDESAIPLLLKYREVKPSIPDTSVTIQDILSHYRYQTSTRSNFRLDSKNRVSYRNGFFYTLCELPEIIINYNSEVIPLRSTNRKCMSDEELLSFNRCNSISILSCQKLDPLMVQIFTPKR